MTTSAPGERFQRIPRPVAALARDYQPGFVGQRHSHPRAQLLHPIRGSMLVMTPGRSWVVPPRRALWLPPGEPHEVHCRDLVSLRSVYVTPEACAHIRAECRVITISPLLTELLNEAAAMPAEYEVEGRDGRVMRLLLDEIGRMDSLPLAIPMPRAEGLAAACRRLLREPALAWTLPRVAEEAGMSERSFTRRFREEAGISFAQWRLQVRLLDAMARLQDDQPVTTVAMDVGYDSPSAFTVAFRRAFGLRPSSVPKASDPGRSAG